MKLRSFLGLLAGLCSAAAFTACTGLQAGSAPSAAIPNIGPAYPGIAAWIVVDANDGHVLLAANADQKRSVASLTKIATAVVVLDYLASHSDTGDDMMMVPQSVAQLGVPSPLGLQPGDGISVRDALYASMMASDNFAAETLGTHFGAKLAQAGLGGSPLPAFVTQMNGLGSRLQLKNTRFANPHGLDLPNASGFSCASDIARLMNHAITIPGFTFYSSQRDRRMAFLRGGVPQSINVRNTNEIIGTSRIDAGKTGTTTLAGPCLTVTAPKPATVVKRGDGSTLVIPHRLTVVVLSAPDRFGAASRLLRDGWSRYDAWRAAGSPAGSPAENLTVVRSAPAAPAPAPSPAPLPAPVPPPVYPAAPAPSWYPPPSGGYQPVPY